MLTNYKITNLKNFTSTFRAKTDGKLIFEFYNNSLFNKSVVMTIDEKLKYEKQSISEKLTKLVLFGYFGHSTFEIIPQKQNTFKIENIYGRKKIYIDLKKDQKINFSFIVSNDKFINFNLYFENKKIKYRNIIRMLKIKKQFQKILQNKQNNKITYDQIGMTKLDSSDYEIVYLEKKQNDILNVRRLLNPNKIFEIKSKKFISFLKIKLYADKISEEVNNLEDVNIFKQAYNYCLRDLYENQKIYYNIDNNNIYILKKIENNNFIGSILSGQKNIDEQNIFISKDKVKLIEDKHYWKLKYDISNKSNNKLIENILYKISLIQNQLKDKDFIINNLNKTIKNLKNNTINV